MKLSITVTGDTEDVINRVKDDYKYGGKASVLLMTALVSHLHREHQREIEAVALGTLTQDHFESTIAGVEPDIDYSNPTGDVVLEEPECTEEEAGNIKVEYTCPPNDTAAAREALTQGAAPEPPDEDEVF